MRVGDGPIDFRALALGCGLELGVLTRPRSFSYRLTQTLAIGILRERAVLPCQSEDRKETERESHAAEQDHPAAAAT